MTYSRPQASRLGCGLLGSEALWSLCYDTQPPYSQLDNSTHVQEVRVAVVFLRSIFICSALKNEFVVI